MKRHAFTLLLFGGLVAALATTASTAPRVIYVSKNGSDANFGTSWSQAWRTIGKVNASAASGDSIVFGSGTWNDATLRLTRGTNSAYTYYACSSLAAPPHIYGADSVGGWTVHSRNVFRASVSSVGNADGLWQGERLLERQTSLNAVSGPGRWYYSSGTVYAYAFGGGDPDNYGMFLSDRSAVTTGGDGSRTYMYGLVLKYGNRSVFDVPIGDAYDSSVIRSCTITSGCGWTGGNPAAIHLSGDYGQEFIHYNRITNCVLGGAQAYYVPSLDGIGTYDFSGGNSASLLIHHMRNSVIDSNLFIDGGEDGHSWMKSGGIAEEALNVVWFANRFVENTKT